MIDARGHLPPILEWGWAGSALERESGDLHLVLELSHGALVAVIDGLGHGGEAAIAARAASEVLAARAGEPVHILVQRCHEGLRRTRGVAMSLAVIDARVGTLTWVGVGNVEGILLRREAASRRREAICSRGGVVGYQLPELRPITIAVAPGDLLIMATDGIRTGFADNLSGAVSSPGVLAQEILAQHAKASDDALVLVARYRGIE